ncbi:MAG: shikimate kinase [marine bacterium B5-7]|nr:MAG: shikimate kinase [marine bacterium B5-7]
MADDHAGKRVDGEQCVETDTSNDGNIVLVGPMGVGKTTVGKMLAKLLSKQFIDCDLELERRTGVSVTTIFEIEGEDGFRRRESALLAEVAARTNHVIATGGGVVMREENHEILRRAGRVIYLTAPVRKLLRRTRNNRNRPLLNTADPKATLEELMQIRDPLYRQVAELVLKVDDRSPDILAHRIVKEMQQPGRQET